MTDEEILKQAREQFAADEKWEKELREEYKEDRRFEAGFQWPEHIVAQRSSKTPGGYSRPMIVDNPLPSFLNLIINEARQNKPSIQFVPQEDADKEVAKIREGLARRIQYDSQASIAYETANHCQVAGSFGYFRMVSEYCDNDTFDQELKIKEIVNPLSVYGILRPAILRQKCRHAFVVEMFTKEEYKRQYGESAALESFDAQDSPGWITDEEIRVAEYWWIETTKKKIVKLPDGSVIDFALLPEELKGAKDLETRFADVDTVRWCKMNGAEILPDTKTVWVEENIPIYAVLGGQIMIDDKPVLLSLIRFMRSPLQLRNYAKSRIAENLMAAPISGWIGAEGQFEGHEAEWDEAAVKPVARLEYKPKSIDGVHPLPPPHRDVFEPPIGALSAFVAQETDSLKQNTGVFDASRGAQSNETSGRGIEARQQQSNQANLHWLDNLGRAQEACGRDLAEAIPKIYDGVRTVQILGEDETRDWAKINQFEQDENGQTRTINDLSAGKYDVVVKIGRTYSTKRLEAFDRLIQFAQADKTFLASFGDIVFENSDTAGADRIAKRYKKLLPPDLAESEDEKQKPIELPPAVQAQLRELLQESEQMEMENRALKVEIAGKKMELDSKERIVAMQQQGESMRTLAKLQSEEAINELKLFIEQQNRRIEESLAVREREEEEEEPEPEPAGTRE